MFEALKQAHPTYEFRLRQAIRKQEINEKLQSIDARLGQTLFVKESKIKPDGGVVEVLDKDKKWRVILVSEAKFQGKDIEWGRKRKHLYFARQIYLDRVDSSESNE